MNYKKKQQSKVWKLKKNPKNNLLNDYYFLAIENKLVCGINDVLMKVNDSMKSCQLSVETLQKYSESLKLALDDNNEELKDNQWFQVTQLFDQQTSEVKNANEKINYAKYSILS
jgi:hypothetical protein